MKKATIQFTTEILGTIPKSKEIYQDYIETKRPDGGSDEVDIETIEEKGWTGFHSDEHGLFVFEYVIKGFLKHWGNELKDVLKVKALRSKIDNIVFISPRRIYFTNENGIIQTPDGVVERPLRAMTMQGPRVSLARSDMIESGAKLNFTLEILDNGKKEITYEMLEKILQYGVYAGLGQFRNGGYGRFEVAEFTDAE